MIQELTATARPVQAVTAKPMYEDGIYMDRLNGTMESPSSLQPEHELWSAFLRLTIEDATGLGPFADARCTPCHLDDWDCGCKNFNITLPIVPLPPPSQGLTQIRMAKVRKGWPREPAVTGAIKYIVEKDGVLYYRQLMGLCKSSHTNQDCAQRWLASPDCVDVCEMLGLEPDHVRRLAGI